MSGTKWSRIELEREHKARQEALAGIRELAAQIESLKQNIRAAMAQMTDGVRKSFSKETEKARLFLQGPVGKVSPEMDSRALTRLVTELEGVKREGMDVLSVLIDIKEVRREARARSLLGELEILKAELGGIMPFVSKWKSIEMSGLKKALDAALAMVEEENFADAEESLTTLRAELTRIRDEVTSLEEQDNRRGYVLQCLRKVCRDMGWDETMEPHLEGDTPDSDLLYEVNTYSSGKMLFRLTLEGIHVNAPITTEGNMCYRQFDDLSHKLKTWGVMTKFERVESADDEPKLMQKGELDFPDEAIGMVREA